MTWLPMTDASGVGPDTKVFGSVSTVESEEFSTPELANLELWTGTMVPDGCGYRQHGAFLRDDGEG